MIRTDRGGALAVWAGEAASPRLWLATAADLDAQLGPLRKNLDLRVSVFDADGSPLVGDAPTAGSLSLTPADTRLPFVLAIAPGGAGVDGTDALRRRLVLGGLAGVIGLILAAAYGLYRATARELTLARQQSDFVSAVSHEFRTPLTSMRHLTDLLVSRGVTSEERRTHYYGLLAHETERLYRMVEALLSFGRIEAGAYALRLEPVAPAAVVEPSSRNFAPSRCARPRDLLRDRQCGAVDSRGSGSVVARAVEPARERREILGRRAHRSACSRTRQRRVRADRCGRFGRRHPARRARPHLPEVRARRRCPACRRPRRRHRARAGQADR